MPDTLRELVVSLSLQSENFSTNIKSVQAQIKEAESEFKAAGAGVDKFSTSTQGAAAKAGMLSSKLSAQNQITQQYERAMKAANTTLEKAVQKQNDLSAKLTAAKSNQAAWTKEVDRAKASLTALAQEYGADSAEVANMSDRLDEFKAAQTAATAEVKQLEGQLTKQAQTVQRAADSATKMATSLNEAKAAEAATKAELDKTNRAIATHKAQWEAASASLDKFGKRAATAGQGMAQLGQSLTMYVTTPLLAAGGYAIKASIDAESAFAGVRKTVDMTDAEFVQLDKDIRNMTFVKASDYAGIAKLAEVGGQLGVTNDNLEKFTATMTDLGVSTNLAGEEGASELAKFANITQMAQGNFDRLGATLVDLGNNMATTEADTMAMAMRLGAAGSQVGLTQAQILGFSAALSSVGLEAEAGGSAFSKAMIGMQIAVETGKNGLKDYAKVAGMSSKDFQKAWKTDAAGAIESFIVGLSKMDESGVSAIKTLNDMGFNEIRLRDTLLRASNASGLFSSAQGIATKAWQKNTALTEEAGKRYSTTASRLTMLKSRATDLARTYGDDLSPAMNDLIDGADKWLESLSEMDAGQRQTLLTTAAWIAAIGPGILLIGKLNTGIGAMSTGFSALIKTSVEAGGGLKGVLAATGSLLGPAGIAVLAGAAIYGATQWYDYASGAKAAREATANMMKTAEEWSSSQAKTIFDTGNDPFSRFKLSDTDFAGADEGNKQLTKLEKQYDKLLKTINKGGAGKKTKSAFGKNVEQTIELRFELAQGDGGFDKLMTGVQAEIDRLKALGMEPTASTYADALSAAAKGNTEQVDALNGVYSEQYAEIMKITDETERKSALEKLNAEYQEQMAAAAERYAAAIAKLTPGAFETPEVKEGAEQFKTLNDLIDKYTKAGSEGEKNKVLEDMANLTKDMDEGTLTSFLATMQQVDSQAQTLKGLNIDPTTIIPTDQLETATTGVKNFSDAVTFLNGLTGPDADKLSGLKEMLSGSVTDELTRLSGSLNLTPTVSIAQENVTVPADLTLNALAKFTGYLPPDATPTLDSLAAFVGYTPPSGEKPTLDSIAAFVGYTPPAGETVTLDALAAFVSYSAPATQPALASLAEFVGYTPPKGDKPTLASIANFVGYTPPETTPQIEVTAKLTFNPLTFQNSSTNIGAEKGPIGIGASDIEMMNNITAAYEAYKAAQFSDDPANGTSLEDVFARVETTLGAIDIDTLKTFVEQYKALLDSGGTPSEEQTAQMQTIANLLQVLSGAGADGDGVTKVTDALNGIFSADWSSESLDPAVEALQTLVDKAEAAGTDTATKFNAAVKDGKPDATAAGIEIGQTADAGVAAGVDQDAYKVKNAMKRLAMAALKAAKEGLVVKSPSHVMRDQVGVMIPRGVVQGIEEETARQQQAVQNAFRSLVQPALSGAESGINGVNNYRTDNRNQSLTVQIINPKMGDKMDARAAAYEILGVWNNQTRALGGTP